MDLTAVVAELAEQLDEIEGLNVYPYPADSVTAPAALFWPENVEYDLNMARGSDRLTLTLWVAVGRAHDKTAWQRLAGYASGSGTASVKEVLEAGTYTELESVRVTGCTFGELTVSGASYLAGLFTVDILGSGE